MEYATFKKWLSERGCRFDTQPEERGEANVRRGNSRGIRDGLMVPGKIPAYRSPVTPRFPGLYRREFCGNSLCTSVFKERRHGTPSRPTLLPDEIAEFQCPRGKEHS